MQRKLDIGSILFFNILIICLISSIYFNVLPQNEITLGIGIIFSIFYFGINIYIGYKYNLRLKEAFVVGIIGSGICLFLGIFSLYTNFILNKPNEAIWLIKPYFSPTLSIVKIFSIKITLASPFVLMLINIALVIFGSISKNIVNKLSS